MRLGLAGITLDARAQVRSVCHAEATEEMSDHSTDSLEVALAHAERLLQRDPKLAIEQADAILEAMSQLERDGCIANDFPHPNPGFRRTRLPFPPDAWQGKDGQG